MVKNKPKQKKKESSGTADYKAEIDDSFSSKKGKDSKSSFIEFLKSEKFRRASGVFTILLSLFLLLSFISYFFFWWADFDKIADLNFSEVLLNTHISVENWGGRLGAYASYFFIEKLVGVSAFGFVLIFFIAGFQLVRIPLLPLSKVLYHTTFWMLWGSFLLGYIFSFLYSSYFDVLAGTFGVQLSIWSNGFAGKFGTAFILFFSLVTFLILTFNVWPKFRFLSTEKIFSNNGEDGIEKEYIDLQVNVGKEAVFAGRKNVFTGKETSAEEDDLTDEELETALNFEVVSKPKQETKSEPDFTINSQPANTGNTSESKEIDFVVGGNSNIEMNELQQAEEEDFDEAEFNSEVNLNGAHFGADEPYDPCLDLPHYQMPSLDFLIEYETRNEEVTPEELVANKDKIVNTLKNYAIDIVKIVASPGPTVTLYEIVPAPGIRISKIKNLEDDIALSLSALGIRIIAPIPGKGTIGIEVPNLKPQIVSMKTMLSSDKFTQTKFDLPVAIGKTISNEPFVADLAKMPHLLMAGATGQGKSVGLNAIITSLIYKKHPAQLKFVMVDPKKVELSLYTKIERHYLAKLPDSDEAIITDTRKVVRTLNSLCIEMDQRYDLLKDAQVRNIKEYNAKFIARKLNPNDGHRYLPYIVLVVDEFADLIMTAGKEVELPIARLAQLARAIGIHLIIATQRPSVNIITGTIKANFPARVAFRVTSKIDSRTILDAGGAEQLIGRGDMLLSLGSELVRLQCALVDTDEIDEIANFIGNQKGYPETFSLPEYLDENSEPSKDFDPNQRDDKFEEAARIVVAHQHGSTSLLQRKLQLGYNRAGRIIDQLEAAGVVGPFEGSKARDVKIKSEIELEELFRQLR